MKKVIFPLALCLITAACGGDENDGKTEPEMKISSCYVVSSSSGQSENFFSPVGMYITSEAGQPYEGSGVWSASYNSGAWAMDKPVYVTKAGKVYAYYPYSSNDSPPVLPLDMTRQTDVLYSRVASPIAPGSVSLSVKLYHALSKLVVSVKGEEVTGLSLSSPVTCRFNICTGEFTDLQSGRGGFYGWPAVCRSSCYSRERNAHYLEVRETVHIFGGWYRVPGWRKLYLRVPA
ncbi:fimbrillin family protein [Bacteroides uniformis]|nr:fimbrillin family protein [Bacteroides uniformis]